MPYFKTVIYLLKYVGYEHLSFLVTFYLFIYLFMYLLFISLFIYVFRWQSTRVWGIGAQRVDVLRQRVSEPPAGGGRPGSTVLHETRAAAA